MATAMVGDTTAVRPAAELWRLVHPFDDGRVSLFGQALLAAQVNQMTRLEGLGLQVEAVVLVGGHDVRDAPVDFDAMLGQVFDFARVIGDGLDGFDHKRHEHVGSHAVLALVVAEAERQVGLDGINAVLLQAVGADFVDRADATPYLAGLIQGYRKMGF